MKYLVFITAVVMLVCVAAAYWIDSDAYMSYPDEVDDGMVNAMSAVKRRRGGLCMKYGMVCVPESSYKFTKCCGGLNCVCNLWKTHCRCHAKLG